LRLPARSRFGEGRPLRLCVMLIFQIGKTFLKMKGLRFEEFAKNLVF
jgi:hypothetical protein